MLIVILLIHLALLINTRFTLWPEMLVYPFLLNHNFSLYTEIINPYPPAFVIFLANFAKLFGYSPFPYQIFTWIIILITDLLIFFIAKSIHKKILSTYIATIFFVIFSITFSINGLWFDLVQTPLILLSFYFLYLFLKQPLAVNLVFYCFLPVTVAFFIKQQAALVIIWFLILLSLKLGKKSVALLKQSYLALAPLLIFLSFEIIWFWQKNSLSDFAFWTIIFPMTAAKMPGYVLFPTARQTVTLLALFLLFYPSFFEKKHQTNLIIMTALILILFVYPRFDYFHLIPALAILSLAAGENFRLFLKSRLFIKIIPILSLVFLIIFTIRYLANNSTSEIRFFEQDINKAASFIAMVTPPDQPIYIQNGPDQLFPLTNRIPPKPWVDEFPWYLEVNKLQEKITIGIESSNTKIVIFKPYDQGNRYEIGVYRPEKIASFIDNHYQNYTQINDTLWLKTKK